MGFGVRLLVGGLGLWLASVLVPGISVRDDWTLLGAAILLGIVNAIVRPVLVLLVINAGMLGLVASLFQGFTIAGFGSALLGALVISITGWLASWFIGPRGRVEVIVQRSR